jgi:Cu2+-exporting ATPase
VSLTVRAGFSLRAFVEGVESLGYTLGPSRKTASPSTSGLLSRMGICIAIAMNSMLLGVATYAGLSEGPLYHLFRWLQFGLSCASVLVGGAVFIRSAVQGLRCRVLSLDVPVALGIVLAFGSSMFSFFAVESGVVFFDTLCVFIALMLVGRFLQQRVIEQNKRRLLASDDLDTLLVRRVSAAAVETVPCRLLAIDDLLLLSPGDVLPVEGVLRSNPALFSLAWITGESEPVRFERGALVPAGASLTDRVSAEVLATEVFADSSLAGLLRSPALDDPHAPRGTWWDTFARWYVALVLVAAALACAIAWQRAHDLVEATRVVTAVLIVTCPCAFGIATPLAYEIVLSKLRRQGLFVRSSAFLDRAVSVRKVVFDKTGTLTTGSHKLLTPNGVDALDREQLEVLYNLAARSGHPKSAAVRRALEQRGLAFIPALRVVEQPGCGISLTYAGRDFRLGAPSWVASGAPADPLVDLAFGVDDRLILAMSTGEELRDGALGEVAGLVHDGFEVWIASGDRRARVVAMAKRCGISSRRALGDCSPTDKAAFIRECDHEDTLMVGDGINDSPAIAEAWCSGTPAIDRPFMAARSDFYITTPGLAPIRMGLHAAHLLRRTVRLNLAVAIAYNTITVTLAVLGKMSPLVCAIVMPLSSLSTLAVTVLSLSDRRFSWRS